MIFPLTNEEKGHLKRLNENKPLILALKKLFLNTAIRGRSEEIQFMAAERKAIDIIQDAFHTLEITEPKNNAGPTKTNIV